MTRFDRAGGLMVRNAALGLSMFALMISAAQAAEIAGERVPCPASLAAEGEQAFCRKTVDAGGKELLSHATYDRIDLVAADGSIARSIEIDTVAKMAWGGSSEAIVTS